MYFPDNITSNVPEKGVIAISCLSRYSEMSLDDGSVETIFTYIDLKLHNIILFWPYLLPNRFSFSIPFFYSGSS